MGDINLKLNQSEAIQAYVLSSKDILKTEESIETFDLSTVNFSFQLNAILRANLEIINIQPFLNALDSSFKEYKTLEDIIVYRVGNYQEMLRFLDNTTYIDYGYMSTSKSVESTQGFYQERTVGYFPAFITIKIPSGSNVIELDAINCFENNTYESEVLIKRKSRFNIKVNLELSTKGLEAKIGRKTMEDYKIIRIIEMDFVGYLL